MNPPDAREQARPRADVGCILLAGVATSINFVAWLGLDDQRKKLGPDGNLHGPYEYWQVVGLVLGIGVIAAVAGWLGHALSAAAIAAAVMTVAFSYTAANDVDNDGLWPVGAVMVAIGSFAGVLIVAAFTGWLRGRVQSRSRS